MHGKQLPILNQSESQFTQCLQWLHVVAANLAGNIASPTHLALVNNIQNSIRIIDPAI
jgi:hypothetical protein